MLSPHHDPPSHPHTYTHTHTHIHTPTHTGGYTSNRLADVDDTSDMLPLLLTSLCVWMGGRRVLDWGWAPLEYDSCARSLLDGRRAAPRSTERLEGGREARLRLGLGLEPRGGRRAGTGSDVQAFTVCAGGRLADVAAPACRDDGPPWSEVGACE